MAREKSKEKPFKDESTEARHRGGATRSSAEDGTRSRLAEAASNQALPIARVRR